MAAATSAPDDTPDAPKKRGWWSRKS
jgi:hypothetical protein